MHINWFTVIAQILNFFVLVWLLKRFLYKPVLNAVAEREKKISSQLEEANATIIETEKERKNLNLKNETFENEKKALMELVISETATIRQQLLVKVRAEADSLKVKLQKAMDERQEYFANEILQKTKMEVFSIARKTLTDLASTSLEEQTVSAFIKRIKEMDSVAKTNFIEALRSKPDASEIWIRSTFDLPENKKMELENSIDEILGLKGLFNYQIQPELISGIELSANGFKLSWSILSYITSLENSISGTLKQEVLIP
jgi:F-type H+-transporting ATPase subunit b